MWLGPKVTRPVDHLGRYTRVAPLRAYRKTIQFRLLFRLIRSPEVPQNSFQPDTLFLFQSGIRLDFWRNFGTLHWNQPLGRSTQTARADLFFLYQFEPRVLIWLVHSFAAYKLWVVSLFAPKPWSLSLSSFPSSSPTKPWQTLESSWTSLSNLLSWTSISQNQKRKRFGNFKELKVV